MTDTATVTVSLLVEAAEEVQRMVDEIWLPRAHPRYGEDWGTRALHERLSSLAERLRAAADRGEKADIWRG